MTLKLAYDALIQKYSALEKRYLDMRSYESAFQAAVVGLALVDLKGKFVKVNGRLCDELGCLPEDFLKMHISDFKPMGLKRDFFRFVMQLKEKESISSEIGYCQKDGSLISFDLSVSMMVLEGERLFLVVVRNITKLKKVEKELQDQNEKLLSLLNASPNYICFKDGMGRWLLANDFTLQLLKLTGVDYYGKTNTELASYSDVQRKSFLACMESDEVAWKKSEASNVKGVIAIPGGGDRIFEVVKIPIFESDGSRKGIVIVGHDVTEHHRIQEMLQGEISARKNASKVLKQKGKDLEEANVALRVLVKQQNNAVEEVQQHVLAQQQHTVFPYLDLLRHIQVDAKGAEYIDVICSHLQAIGSSFVQKLSDPGLGLTRREVLVADLVRHGKSSKEIAWLLGIQIPSVETYRNKIRKKFKINNKKISLKWYLNDILNE